MSGRRIHKLVIYTLALLATPVLHALSLAPARVSWLAWVCFVPWFAAIRIAGPWPALAITSTTTILGTYLVASWLPAAVSHYYGQSWVIGVLFFVGAWLLTIAPWVWLFTVTYRALARHVTVLLPVWVGAAWAANELLRVRLFIGDPFGLFGYSQVSVLPLAQIADTTGVYGISFVLGAVNAALAELWVARIRRRPLAPAVIGVAVSAALVLVTLVYGNVRLRTAGDSRDAPPTRIAIIQGDVDPGAQWSRESYGANLAAYTALTQTVLHRQPQLVIWPENAMNFFVETEPLYQGVIRRLLEPDGIELLTGGPRLLDGPTPHYFNSAFAIHPNGQIIAVYDKQRLLPFAEYFPLASIELLRREFARVREFTAGGPALPLPTVAGAAGVLICNEVFFGELSAERVARGAGYLVNLANDSWLGDAKYAAQAFDMARLRAIEQRRYLVRASTSGPSAIVDPFGRVLARTAVESRGTLTGAIASRNERTWYARVGDLFAVLCVGLPLGILAARRVRRPSP